MPEGVICVLIQGALIECVRGYVKRVYRYKYE